MESSLQSKTEQEHLQWLAGILNRDLELPVPERQLTRLSILSVGFIEILQLGIDVFNGDAISYRNWLFAHVKALNCRPIVF